MADFPEIDENATVLLNGNVAFQFATRLCLSIIKSLEDAGVDVADGVISRMGQHLPEDDENDVSRSVQFFADVFARNLRGALDGTLTEGRE